MRIYGQHKVIKLGNQTSEMTAQCRFISSYVIETTVVLTKVYVDISDLFLSL
jgi:methyl coenzyme M reductase subunit C